MRVVIIGGSGHIGTYLVPRLLEAGHEVVNVTRGKREPYQPRGVWKSVRQITADRQAEDTMGTFGERIAGLEAEVVIDLICFTPPSARSLCEALEGRIGHYLFCGTIWVHGPSVAVPTTEAEPRHPFGQYGIDKAAIEAYLLDRARRHGFPATILHPGHIVGPGWQPVNPQGNFNPAVFQTIARGEPLALPNLGLETVHHVHADDVAQIFLRAMERRVASIGESFHVVSPQALSLRGYAERAFEWFGREPRLAFAPLEAWKKGVAESDAAATMDHIAHSPNCSIEKAGALLGYRPRYSSLEAVREAVDWLVEHRQVRV